MFIYRIVIFLFDVINECFNVYLVIMEQNDQRNL